VRDQLHFEPCNLIPSSERQLCPVCRVGRVAFHYEISSAVSESDPPEILRGSCCVICAKAFLDAAEAKLAQTDKFS
jgi:hypothetical protein